MSIKLMRRLLDLTINPFLVAATGIGAIAFLLVTEDDFASAAFAVTAVAVVIGVLLLASRRPAFSVYSAITLTLLVVAPSVVKARLTGASLHALDLAHLADPKVSSFLVTGYASYVLPILAVLVMAILFLVMVYRYETPRQVGLVRRATLVVLPALLLPVALPQWASGDDYQFAGKHASAFTASLRELPHLWDEHPLMVRLAKTPPQPVYELPLTCTGAAVMPDIVLVHAESQLPPGDVPSWGTDMLSDSFKSGDDKLRRFGVETYGGSSWVTVSSVMSGLSGADFDWMRQFISASMTGKVDDAVPAVLASCGYDTAGVLTFGYDQFDLGPFLASTGIAKVSGAEETGIPVHGERDIRYYDAALDALHSGRNGGRPQFVYVETMFTHSPYDARQEAHAVFDGEPFHSDPETAEYLRRLVIARQDIEALREQLERNPGPRGTILVEYGDHRPLVAPAAPSKDGKGGLADWRSKDYETYFAVHAYGPAALPAIPDHARLDATYLGYWIVEAAGAATGGVVSDMEALRRHCDGLFHTCSDRAAVDRVLRRRLDADNVRFDPLMNPSS
ncbi:sulfatase-like hydrolase/transferase [Pseudorhizobium flavum]|uniref:Sulfatase N-terminal domain-containing protein n=1 Tax=Pseudorhizobium flavum TaxID=1335061 RepID=A0A7W9Z1L7_9HYPH|nr:sulfatase-like hydrolase/transferase [Pseudorhizobium flavum]MBB6182350.1 hypothetical protein [Pseudorhizobium flavum]CAD6632023.1 sulfatase [Pseudorhizobium flavum]